MSCYCLCLISCAAGKESEVDGNVSSFVVFIGALWFILGGVLQTAAMNRGMMLAGRFIGGFAIGQLSFLAPLYQTEIGKQCSLYVHRPELYT